MCKHLAMAFDFHASYDELNSQDDDYRFYAGLAVGRGVKSAIDLGCGTGTLARLLAAQGIDVVAVDPDPEMLRVAASKDVTGSNAGKIQWLLGYSNVLDPACADLAVMSGHVAQVFTDDESWLKALADLHHALVPGGVLAFESRNPAARKWQDWNRDATLRTVITPDGEIEFWHEIVSAELPLVAYDTFTKNLRTQERQVNRDVLAFRDEHALRSSIERVGFVVTDVLGNWDGSPVDEKSAELIVIASRP